MSFEDLMDPWLNVKNPFVSARARERQETIELYERARKAFDASPRSTCFILLQIRQT